MKVLILSCNTGEGHNSSASALREAMLRQGIECDKVDTLSLVSDNVSRRASNIYVSSTRANVFGTIYKLGEKVSNMNAGLFAGKVKSPVYAANKLYAKKLYDFVTGGGYDAVVCTHLFPAETLTSLKKHTDLAVPVIFVLTDYESIPFTNETHCDAYVIPHRHLIEEFVSKGLPRNRLYPFGIPVNTTGLADRLQKADARRETAQVFGWEDTDKCGRMLLIMGGSMGFGKLGELVDELLAKLDMQDRIICVCGRNEELESSLTSRYAADSRVKVIGYTDRVPLLMNASDVLFSKAGGITSTEAMVYGIPLIHAWPIPGVEKINALFFHYHDISYYTEDLREQVDMALKLCDDESVRNVMLEAQRRNANPRTCEDVIDLVRSLV